MDPKKNKFLISCYLEFQWNNNIVGCKELILALKKAIDLKIECLKVIHDSEIVTRQVCNTIHCVLPHLKKYQ